MMLSTFPQCFLLTLLISSCSIVQGATSNSKPFARRLAFAPSRTSLVSPSNKQRFTSPATKNENNAMPSGRTIRGMHNANLRPLSSSLSMIPSSHPVDALMASPSLLLPSIMTADDEAAAFQDQVTVGDLISDPFLQFAFAAAFIAIVGLFAFNAVLGQMDDAVEAVASDFDRMMLLKYRKKWGKFIADDDGMMNAESKADRIQRIVEEMERMDREEPEFKERVMQDIERMR